ncbi:hypothetical protein F783_009035 [Bordetella holmesii F627]|nr:hypothetical protein F783_009035 [Bordetella holmesii F627]
MRAHRVNQAARQGHAGSLPHEQAGRKPRHCRAPDIGHHLRGIGLQGRVQQVIAKAGQHAGHDRPPPGRGQQINQKRQTQHESAGHGQPALAQAA